MPSAVRPILHPIVVDQRQSSPKSPKSGSPKGVHFPENRSPVSGISRELNSTEAWSLYHFEKHAKSCRACYEPYAKFESGRGLCDTGHALAQDVSLQIYYDRPEIYSRTPECGQLVRVELHKDYQQTRDMLRAYARQARRDAKTPVIHHNHPWSMPSASKYRSYDAPVYAEIHNSQQWAIPAPPRPRLYNRPTEVHVERGRSRHTKSKSQSKYKPILVEFIDDFARLSTNDTRTMQYPVQPPVNMFPGRAEYRTELREPARSNGGKNRYWY